MYDDVGQSVLNNAWDGYNSTLFAYGQTGSGKSWSIVGYGVNKGKRYPGISVYLCPFSYGDAPPEVFEKSQPFHTLNFINLYPLHIPYKVVAIICLLPKKKLAIFLPFLLQNNANDPFIYPWS